MRRVVIPSARRARGICGSLLQIPRYARDDSSDEGFPRLRAGFLEQRRRRLVTHAKAWRPHPREFCDFHMLALGRVVCGTNRLLEIGDQLVRASAFARDVVA